MRNTFIWSAFLIKKTEISSSSNLGKSKAVRFRLFPEPDTRNWKSLDTRVPVNNFVKTHKYSTPECIK